MGKKMRKLVLLSHFHRRSTSYSNRLSDFCATIPRYQKGCLCQQFLSLYSFSLKLFLRKYLALTYASSLELIGISLSVIFCQLSSVFFLFFLQHLFPACLIVAEQPCLERAYLNKTIKKKNSQKFQSTFLPLLRAAAFKEPRFFKEK